MSNPSRTHQAGKHRGSCSTLRVHQAHVTTTCFVKRGGQRDSTSFPLVQFSSSPRLLCDWLHVRFDQVETFRSVSWQSWPTFTLPIVVRLHGMEGQVDAIYGVGLMSLRPMPMQWNLAVLLLVIWIECCPVTTRRHSAAAMVTARGVFQMHPLLVCSNPPAVQPKAEQERTFC